MIKSGIVLLHFLYLNSRVLWQKKNHLKHFLMGKHLIGSFWGFVLYVLLGRIIAFIHV